VERSVKQLKKVNGTKFNVNSLSEVIRLFLKPQEKTIFLSQELKFTLHNAQEMDVEARKV
jgi:hypothetical protein